MTFWNMPTTYYDVVVEGIHFFFLDTSPWVYGEDVYAQGEWITSQYAASNALRKFIVGHHPLWTCGYHHDRDDVSRLRATLLPLLHKHGGVYLSGHDHNMQHIVKDGVQQFISGAGAFNYQVNRVMAWPTATVTTQAFYVWTTIPLRLSTVMAPLCTRPTCDIRNTVWYVLYAVYLRARCSVWLRLLAGLRSRGALRTSRSSRSDG